VELKGMEDDPQRVGVYNPWHYRTRLAPARTYCGRVVYNKRPHLFLVSDVERILKKITPPYPIGSDPPLTFFAWFRRVLEDLWRIVTYNAIGMPSFPQGTIFELLQWAVAQRWREVSNPLEALRTRVQLALITIIDFYDLGDRIAAHYK
jgi:hypothetical protein